MPVHVHKGARCLIRDRDQLVLVQLEMEGIYGANPDLGELGSRTAGG